MKAFLASFIAHPNTLTHMKMLAHRRNHRTSKSAILQYANCWEDTDLLLEGLAAEEGKRILSIASAGDSSFSLLTQNPSEIIAFDHNEVQLCLVELKKMAIKHLNYSEVLEFLGFTPSELRLKYYRYLKGWLSYDAQMYWDKHTDQIQRGIILQGKFEKYFIFFAKRILPMIHSKELIEEMFAEKTPEDQQYYYMEYWNTLKWRLLFKLFFNKRIMGKFGRRPDFKQEVSIPVEDYLFQRTESHLSSVYAAHNPFLRFALTGSFGKELPHYLRPDNFPIIKENIDHILLKKGLVEDVLRSENHFDYFNLSNTLENSSDQRLSKVARAVAKNSRPNARFAYWNLTLQKRLSEVNPRFFLFHEKLSVELSRKDQGFFYRKFIFEVKA